MFTIFLASGFYYILNSQMIRDKNMLLESRNKNLEASYRAVVQMYSISVSNYFHNSIMQPRVIDLLKQASTASEDELSIIRGTLYRELYPTFKGDLAKNGITQLQFHKANGDSLLRFHRPDKNADPLLDVRPLLKQVHDTKTFGFGFEGGRFRTAFRYIYPIFDDKELLAMVDLSLYYDQIVKELSKLLTAKHYLLVTRKNISSQMVFEQQKNLFVRSPFSDEFTLINPKISVISNNTIKSPMVEMLNPIIKENYDIEKLLLKGDSFSLPVIKEDKGYCVNFFAIKDANKNLAGYITTYENLDELLIIEEKYRYFITFGLVAIAFLGYFLYYYFLQKKRILVEKIQFEAIVNNTTSGIILLNEDHTIRFINKQGLETLEYTAAELLNKDAHDMIHFHPHILKDSACPIINALSSRTQYTGEEIFVSKNGVYLVVHTTVIPFEFEDDEIGAMLIFENITEEKKNKEMIEHLAYYDSLTNLPNRKLLIDRLEQAIAHSGRSMEYCGILFIDIDNFKTLNDTQGHNVGDTFLQEIAVRLHDNSRTSDTVSRFGGDEFIVLTENLGTNKDEAMVNLKQIANKLRLYLNKPYFLDNLTYYSTASIGGVVFCGNSKNADDVLKLADNAMYDIKKSSKDDIKIVFF